MAVEVEGEMPKHLPCVSSSVSPTPGPICTQDFTSNLEQKTDKGGRESGGGGGGGRERRKKSQLHQPRDIFWLSQRECLATVFTSKRQERKILHAQEISKIYAQSTGRKTGGEGRGRGRRGGGGEG